MEGANYAMTFPIYPRTERQKRLVALAGELADTFARRANEGEWAGHFPYENYRDLHQSGYLALTVPRDFGGEGADVLDTLLAQARLAQGCASTALVAAMHLSTIGRIAASTQGPNPLFERICSSVVHDGALINGAATEPGTGSPSRGGRPSTTARRQIDGSWLLNGRKTYTTGSLSLRFFLVSCSIEDDTPAEAKLPRLSSDQASFLVPHDAPGVRIEETWDSVSMRTSASNDLILANVHLGPNALADTLGTFTPASMAQLGAWSFPIHAVYLGIAQGARDEAIRFAQRRRPNSLDKPISSVPHIQEKVAKIELILLQSEAVVFGLVEQYLSDSTSIPASQFAAAKYLVTNHAVEVVDLAMRIVGGASLSLQRPLQRYYRDVRAGLHHPPMDDATFSLLSQQALKES
jgi:alkylation response protein AidB-like acyl-CoA dehydrogenase